MPQAILTAAILTADDFGLSEAVNEAVERAHRHGLLTSASLMVSGPAATDAVRRARALPRLKIGLHVVVIEGAPTNPTALPGLLNPAGQFPSAQLALSLRYAFSPTRRRQLAAEIRAQFNAFRRTGLPLDHANAHKHMQLHPVVGQMIIDVGADFRLPALRIPQEPPGPLRRAGTGVGLGGRALNAWTTLLRHQARRAGLRTNDAAFGIAWSGHMTEQRLLRLIPHLPPGLNELYFHPATHQDPHLAALMPGYEPAAELTALTSPTLRAAMDTANIRRTTYTAT